MSWPEKPPARCPWCGEMMPGDAPTCPHCHREQEHQDLRPLGGPSTAPPPPSFPPTCRAPSQEPLPPAPGQEPFGTLANIRSIARADRVFAALLALLALDLLLAFLSGYPLSTIICAATLWGVVTFRWWGYLLAMLSAGLNALLFGVFAAALVAEGHGGFGLVWTVLILGVNLFVLIVLYTRRQHFD